MPKLFRKNLKNVKFVHPSTNITRNKKTALNIHNVARPIYIISRFCGMFPFSIRYNANAEMENVFVTKFDAILFLVSISFYTAIVYFSVNLRLIGAVMKENLLVSIILINLLAALLLAILCICMNMIQREKLLFILQQIDSFDQSIKSLGVKMDYAKHKRFVAIVYVAIISVIITMTAMENVKTRPSPISIQVAFLAQIINLSTVLLLYSFNLLSIRIRYMLLNQIIRFEWSQIRRD